MKKFIIIILIIGISFSGFVSYRINDASAPLKAIYGNHFSLKLNGTKIFNLLSEPIVICGTLYDPTGLERGYILWGNDKERWVHLEGMHAMFTDIKGLMCK